MTHKEQNKILNDKIESNNNQYKIDRLNAEISAFSSGNLNKYEFLTRKELNYKPNALDKARFEFSPLGKTCSMGLNKNALNYQEEGVIKLLKDIKDGLTDRINIPPKPPKSSKSPKSPKPPKSSKSPELSKSPKDTKLTFAYINKIKENIPKKDQELDEIKKRIGRIFYMSDDILIDGINVEKMLLAINYDTFERLNDKLKNNNLSIAESKKINDDIIENKNKILKRKQLIYDYKKVLEKRITTDQNK